jgi:transcriptional regulator GlxA family with amidase domain
LNPGWLGQRSIDRVAFRVGYQSPSPFSREYNRQFGAPPLRDITKLRQEAVPLTV